MIKELIVKPATVVKPPPAAQSFWQNPPVDSRLEFNEVHLWLARLDAEDTPETEQIISGDEQARADRFRFDLHKRQFIAARAKLRTLLGSYLQQNPRDIRFKYGEFGKPFLADEWLSEIKFSMSHAGDLALYAVSRCREIGVDLELINPSFVDETMIAYCLTEQEKAHFQTLPKSKREQFFFECWTRKESYLKAWGMGLSIPPNEIDTLSFSNSSADFTKGGCGFKPASWSLQTLPFITGYAAALAIEGNSPRLRFWRWSNTDLS